LISFSAASGSPAEDSGFRLWPFGGGESEPAVAPEKDDKGWFLQSPLANVGWPKIEMPKLQLFPSLSDGEGGPTLRERITAPFARLNAGRQRLVDGTRETWARTVDAIRFGDDDQRVAQRSAEPGFFSRLFSLEPEEPEGPRTVTEWMAQDRIDP
jgi:hypothetical protein